MEAFSTLTLGLIGAAYFAGFMAGCIKGATIVKRVGHIRSFAAFASIASAVPLVHLLWFDPIAWGLLRAVSGFCFAGLFMVIESWLNEQASNEHRGGLFSTYLIFNFIAITVGQLLLNVASPGEVTLFIVASILTSVALVPIALTQSVQPGPVQSVTVDLKKLYRISPVGAVGCFVVGLTNGPFWSLGPVFAQNNGLDIKGISFFMTLAILGGAAAQWPLGRLSDRIDRRWVMVGQSGLAVMGGGALVTASLFDGEGLLLGAATLFGASALSLYGICVAHANDQAGPEDFVVMSAGLLLAFAVGAILGPLAVSVAAPFFGLAVVFFFTAATHFGFMIFVVYRIWQRAALPPEVRRGFTPVPISRTGPTPLELDPRAELPIQKL